MMSWFIYTLHKLSSTGQGWIHNELFNISNLNRYKLFLQGIYKTMQMKGRIEAYETGKIIPMKHLTDEEHFEMERRVKNYA